MSYAGVLLRREDSSELTFKPRTRPPRRWLVGAGLLGVLGLRVGAFYLWNGMEEGGLGLVSALVFGPVRGRRPTLS